MNSVAMGYDSDCIPNIHLLPKEYFCAVCDLLVYPTEALQSVCSHLYCKPCLAYVVSTTRACPRDGSLVTEADAKPLLESDRVLADTIDNVVVHCLYQVSGCEWFGFLSESSLHCSGCAFGDFLGTCKACGSICALRHVNEHLKICPGIDEFYKQHYDQNYQNDAGYDMHQQHAPMSHSPQQFHPRAGLADPHYSGQHQVPYAAPGYGYVAQTHPQVQPQPQFQYLHQPHPLSPPPPVQGLASQGLHHHQAHVYPPTAALPQDPPNQQFHYHFHIQNVMHPQANVAQSSQPHQPHAYPQPSNAGLPSYNMPVHDHQVGTQPPPQVVQNHFPQQVPHVPPPHSLATMQTHQPPLASQLTRTQYLRHLVQTYGGDPVMHFRGSG
ncbi:unnamed protein product [Thlaspi arvense]|uniref:RING-type domain-containing protein n=1 Tax=Thlaspi arvense TaxID=13288 RepID=A0AAU9SQX6_THLAR|nr:unnamed protein product [Thlaspi arvense]